MAETQRPHSDPDLEPIPTDEGLMHVGAEERTGGRQQKEYQDLLDELARLSDKVVKVVQTAWSSLERQRMEDDLRKGVNSVAQNLEQSIRRAGESQAAQDLRAQTKDVAEDINERMQRSEVVKDLTVGLAQGLRTLGDKLDEWNDEMVRREPGGKPASGTSMSETHSPASSDTAATQFAPDESQDIPIERG